MLVESSKTKSYRLSSPKSFFFNPPPTTDIYTLSLHDALPICSLTATSDIPGGPPRHFCGPATQTSSCQESASRGMPPSDETQSTSVSTPRDRAIGPIREQSLKVPDGVSEWTTHSSSVSGCSSR